MKSIKLKKKLLAIFCLVAVLISASCMNMDGSIADLEVQSQELSTQTDIEKNSEEEGISLVDSNNSEDGIDITHSKEAEPDYEVVFPQDTVNRVDITISTDNWAAMVADMTEKFGALGTNNGGGRGEKLDRPQEINPMPQDQNQMQPLGNNRLPRNQDQIQPQGNNAMPQNQGEAQPQGMGLGGGGLMEGDDANPIWVPVTIEFEGDVWSNVGMRFKGNSSLKSSWQSGNLKMPFKLDFDEFEDVYEEIDDQRFYGFKQLSFSSNFKDASYLHEKVAADIFREAGVPAAQTAFYEVYVDYGDGPIYFGLYTMVEVIDDTVIETQFTDDSGNVYKPSGKGATFSAGSFSEASFDKETNQEEGDYSDILALYAALHADTRTTDPQAWRSGLEAIFDVPGFLNYLAVNTVIQNWDTYGVMSHNYYLYHDPDTDLLTWIPWDNNEALKSDGGRGIVTLSLDEVNEQWPLIRFLLDDPVYHTQYVDNVENVINGAFEPQTIIPRLQELHDLVQPYVIGSQGVAIANSNLSSESAFENSLQTLIQHVNVRYQQALEFVCSF